MGFVKEFKEFALKGNVVDLAIAVIIGGAFGAIVTSLVDDIITPGLLAPLLKQANLQNLQDLVIPGTAIKYGSFLSHVISFIIISLVLFLIIKGMNSFKKKEAIAPTVAPLPTETEKLLASILAELKNRPL